MLPDGAAERLAAARIVGGDRLTADRRTEPAHAMGQARRPEPDLRVAEALADFPEDAILADAHIMEFDFGVAARRIAVHRIEQSLDRETGRIHVGEKHRRPQVAAISIFGPR